MLDQVSTARVVDGGAPPGGFGYLGVLVRAKAALDGAVEVAVPAGDLRRFPDQPRRHFDQAALRALSDSIDAGGQTTTGLIRRAPGPTEYELIDGERRWRAIQMIPAERRPLYRARLVEADDEVVQFLLSGVANFNREGHAPLETCDTIERLVGFGFPMREIAVILGVSEYWAYQMHGLRRLTPEVRAMLEMTRPHKARLPLTAAIEISKCAARLQKSLAERALRRDVTLAGLRAEVVEASRASGEYVRLRSVAPDQRWRVVRNKTAAVARAMRDVQLALAEQGVASFVGSRSAGEVEQVEAQLRVARGAIDAVSRQIASLRVGGRHSCS